MAYNGYESYNGYDYNYERRERESYYFTEEPYRHGQLKMVQFHRLPIGSRITLVNETEGEDTVYTMMELVELKDETFIAKVLMRSNTNRPISRRTTEMHYTDAGLKPYRGGDNGDLWNRNNWIRVDWINSPRNIAARARRMRRDWEQSQDPDPEKSIRWQEAGF